LEEEMPGQHIVVSGGGGFLGRYLIQTLVRRRVLCGGQAIKSIAILDAGQDTEAKCGE
jgi:thioester reductase-like protein